MGSGPWVGGSWSSNTTWAGEQGGAKCRGPPVGGIISTLPFRGEPSTYSLPLFWVSDTRETAEFSLLLYVLVGRAAHLAKGSDENKERHHRTVPH